MGQRSSKLNKQLYNTDWVWVSCKSFVCFWLCCQRYQTVHFTSKTWQQTPIFKHFVKDGCWVFAQKNGYSRLWRQLSACERSCKQLYKNWCTLMFLLMYLIELLLKELHKQVITILHNWADLKQIVKLEKGQLLCSSTSISYWIFALFAALVLRIHLYKRRTTSLTIHRKHITLKGLKIATSGTL